MNQEAKLAKQQVIDTFKSRAQESSTIVIAEYRGLNVAQLQEVRRALRAEGAELCVYKNSLVARAVKELGYDGGVEALEGPNAIIFSAEYSNGPKIVNKYSRRFGNVLAIKGGFVEGKFLDSKAMVDVAKMPGREGLISMFLSCLQAPIRQFACAVQAVADAK